jgi:sialic acid synthase SpsE
MATLNEINDAVEVILKCGLLKNDLIILHCTSSYPTKMEDVNLRAMKTIADKFNVKFGYSDHTLGLEVPIAAVALGACVIEKHFTDDNSRFGPDHKFSMNPKSWSEMIKESRRLEDALGDGIKKIEKNELESYYVQRRSVYTLKDLKKGHLLNKKDLICLRPYIKNSISPQVIDKFYGKKVKKNIPKNSIIKRKWLL